MKPSIVESSSATITLKALDALGQIMTGYSATANQFSLSDGVDNYPVTSVTWSNGIGTMVIEVPATTGSKTLVLSLDGNPISTYPLPLEVEVIVPYQGRFDTTNAVLAYDMAVTGATDSVVENYADLGNVTLGASNGTYIPAQFTSTSAYKVVAGGADIILGQYRACISGANLTPTGGPVTTSGSTAFAELFTNVDYTVGLPIKTISLALVHAWGYDVYGAATPYRLYWDTIAGTNHGDGFVFSSNRDANTLKVLHAQSDFVSIPNQYFNFDKLLCIITLTIDDSAKDGSAIVKTYANANLINTSTVTLSSAERTWGGAPAAGISVPAFLGGSEIRPLFELVCYNDVKDAAFIAANANAWGL